MKKVQKKCSCRSRVQESESGKVNMVPNRMDRNVHIKQLYRNGAWCVVGLAALVYFYVCQPMNLDTSIGKFRSEMEELKTRQDLVLKKLQINSVATLGTDSCELNSGKRISHNFWQWIPWGDHEKRTEKACDVVSEWLNEVEKLMQEAKREKTEIETSRIDKKIRWYKKMHRKAYVLNIKYNEFEPFSNSGNIELFASTKHTLDHLLEALHDNKSYIVGLHGMPGSGKTKLVKFMIENKAKFLKSFDIVVFATDPQYPRVIDRIQREFVEFLNLPEWLHDGCCEVYRAKQIAQALPNSKKKSLVILDDLRAKLELSRIGIQASKRCKVLLTTPSLKVCDSMHCDTVINMKPLYKKEAWMWFKKHAQIDDDDDNSQSNILNVAREVVVECNGLPQRLNEVGSSLKNKPIEKWQASLDRLRQLNSISTAQYHIFLSFRGEDTRYTFTGSLYDALRRAEFKVFMDDGGLQSGDQISKALVEAIQQSRLSIVVFSENYANSSWCLGELFTILECMKSKNQLVWPIFYKVDPADVRKQKNSFEKGMDKQKIKFGNDSEEVQNWTLALTEAANLAGEHFTTGYEYEFIQKIVKKGENIKDQLRLQN